MTTTVVTVEEVKDKDTKEVLDKSADSFDDSKLLSPDEGKGKKRKKVKKSKSFKDTLKEKLGMTKKEKEKERPHEV